MPTTLRYSATNGASAGLTITTGATAWVYGTWTVLDHRLTEDIFVSGITFNINTVGATDTTREFLIEIGVGASGEQVVKLQVPYSQRVTTAVGIMNDCPRSIIFPEPMLIRSNSKIWARANTGMTGTQTISGLKLQFQNNLYQMPFAENAYTENYKRVYTPNGISSGIGGTM